MGHGGSGDGRVNLARQIVSRYGGYSTYYSCAQADSYFDRPLSKNELPSEWNVRGLPEEERDFIRQQEAMKDLFNPTPVSWGS